MVVAAGSERQAREESLATEVDMALLRDAPPAFQLNAQLFADGTAAAIAADHVPCSDPGRLSIRILDFGVDAGSVLRKADQFASEADIRLRQAFNNRFQQRLQRVL